jgi:hypothetical protein
MKNARGIMKTMFSSIPFVGKAFADSGPITLANPLSCSDLVCAAGKVADFIFTIAIPICGIILLIGGFQLMTAAGEPDKISKGKKTLLWAVIGFVVIFLSGSIAYFIQSVFGGTGS